MVTPRQTPLVYCSTFLGMKKKFWVVQSLESSNFKALHNHTPGISRDSDQNLLILRGLDQCATFSAQVARPHQTFFCKYFFNHKKGQFGRRSNISINWGQITLCFDQKLDYSIFLQVDQIEHHVQSLNLKRIVSINMIHFHDLVNAEIM